MPGPGTYFLGGPVLSGTTQNQTDAGAAVLAQKTSITQNGTATVSGATITIPQSSQIIDILVDTTTAWNSGTSDTLSVGITAGGTQYASGVTGITSAGRIRPTFTGTQLTNMLNVGTSTAVVATVTPSGTAATTGASTVTIVYQQTVQTTLGET